MYCTRSKIYHFLICNYPKWGRGHLFNGILFGSKICLRHQDFQVTQLSLAWGWAIVSRFCWYLEFLNWGKLNEVMIYFAFLQTLILLVSIFKPVFNLLYILKTNMVNNPQRVMASVIVVRYFDLKGLKFWKNYEWNMRKSSDRNLRP